MLLLFALDMDKESLLELQKVSQQWGGGLLGIDLLRPALP